MGNSIAANMFMVGYAFQKGALPLSAQSIETAIEMNGEAVAMNQAAFRWGRRAALDAEAVESLIPNPIADDDNRRLSQTFDEVVARRVAFLTEYQNAAYARRYADLVANIRTAEETRAPGRTGLSDAVARNLFKLMAYKDEYEVARLYTDGNFVKQVASTFEPGNLRFEFHLAPPLLARRDKATGEPRKMSFGPWMMKAFGLLRRFKGLRGTAFDPFGYTEERRTERKLIADYEAMLSEVSDKLTADNHPLAVGLAVIPEKIRGFGHVKARNLTIAKADEAALLEQFRSGGASMLKAAE
jgi:indolepyruvate ferredoxin oxidoreductase